MSAPNWHATNLYFYVGKAVGLLLLQIT